MQTAQSSMTPKNKNPWIISLTVLVILAILGLGYWWWKGKMTGEQEEVLSIDQIIAPGDDRTAAINEALESVTIENFDAEFQAVDAELESL